MLRELMTAWLATAGYCILMNVPRRLFLPATLGGMLGWGMYLLLKEQIGGVFYLLVLVGAICAAWSELAAKRTKAPATIFLIPGLIPLVPGGYAYNTMLALVQSDFARMRSYALLTAKWAGGLAAGISLVAVVHQLLYRPRKKAENTGR